MSFSSVQRFSPAVRALLPTVTARSITFENSKIYPLMLRAFKDGSFAPFMQAWRFSETEKWDGNTTTLHMLAKHMPRGLYFLGQFQLHVTGNETPIVKKGCIKGLDITDTWRMLHENSAVKDMEGNTPIQIALKEKNWHLARYLKEFSKEPAFDAAMTLLKSIEFQPFSPQVAASLNDGYDYNILQNFLLGCKADDWNRKDENGWTLAHWIAFKGFSKNEIFSHRQHHWECDEDKNLLTPKRIASFIRYVSNESINNIPELEKHFLPNLPAKRREELTQAITQFTEVLKNKIERGLSVIADDKRDIVRRQLHLHFTCD